MLRVAHHTTVLTRASMHDIPALLSAAVSIFRLVFLSSLNIIHPMPHNISLLCLAYNVYITEV